VVHFTREGGLARHFLPCPKSVGRESGKNPGFFLAWRLQSLGCGIEPERIPCPMDNALLVNLSHQLAAQAAMDTIANNIANANTNGYRREEMKFEELLRSGRGADWQKNATQTTRYVKEAGIVRDLTEGRIVATGNTLDLAMNGDGYFVVQTARGERFTRDGHFTLNAEGQIVTETGDALLSDGGPITITNEDGDVKIAADGTISGDQGQIGKLRVAQFADSRALVKEGGSLYGTTQTPTDAESGYKIAQGMIESSNVQPVTEITDMISVMRSYQAVANLIQSQEDLKFKAVDKLGSVPS
jgi:flagellar basal-body rod protein FlgF